LPTKRTAIQDGFRQTTRQGVWMLSEPITSVNLSGMPTGEITSSAAPVSEKFRTVQSIAPLPNEIFPNFSSRRRGAVLCSSTAWSSAGRDDLSQTRTHCHLFPKYWGLLWIFGARMTPRERKDMPWLIAAFVVVILIILGGIAFSWR
jgi:hypothetical protein